MEAKVCTKCKELKLLTEYPLDKRKEGRRKAACTYCYNEYHRIKSNEYFKRNKEARREYARRTWNSKGYRKYKKSYCEHCSFIAIHSCQLDVDHIDGNHSNNDISNLQTLCSNCHRLKTFVNKEGRKRN